MDSGLSTVRNLLYIVLVLALLSIVADGYVGMELSSNSEELDRLSTLLQKQLMTSAVGQSEALQKQLNQVQSQMDTLHQDANSFDARMDAQQTKFFKELDVRLPQIMDKYIKSRAPMIERQAIKQMPH